MVATHIDVTERKTAQKERERVRQLETDLAPVNRLSVMGELTASLAHEILHPIATSRNNARAGMRFLEMSPPNLGEVKEVLACVVRDVDRAKDIVARIRDQMKKAPPRMDPFDLNEAIHEVIAMARSAIGKNRVSVHTRLMNGLNPVRGDRVQLQHVILNLVLNSVEAMSSVEKGLRELSISTNPLDRVTVRLSHSKIYAGDCANCETQEGLLDRIDRAITLTGSLDESQRARLMEIADKCPVHRTLTSEIEIRTVEEH
jgi:C4-dicarboxylate-specific signal transduction histidine kinase